MSDETLKIDQVLDLKGVVCPYTFVKSKLKLEEMESGEVLKIVIDNEPAMKNVPKSIENDGHELLEIKKVSDTEWNIIVKKD